MNTRFLLRLFYASISAVLLTLATVCMYALRSSQRAADSEIVGGVCGTYSTGPFADSLVQAGQRLWAENICAACHASNMQDDMTAPALAGVSDRWADYPREDLYAWVRNSQRLIGEGHPRAREIWGEWQPTVMPNYGNLTDTDVEALLRYIDAVAQR